jgi:hypothetical protein
MLCMLGIHREQAEVAWNGGIGFSRCRGCGTELVRRPGARWRRVPQGYAVVWRPRTDTVATALTVPAAAADRPRLSIAMQSVSRAVARLADGAPFPTPRASLAYRHLARQIRTVAAGGQAPRIVSLGAACDAGPANEAALMIAAMMQDELGGRLLLIDATLGAAGVSATLGAGDTPGLSDLSSDEPWAAIELVRMLPRPHLFLLGAGLTPAAGRPDRLAPLLPALARRFDHILIQQRSAEDDTRHLALAAQADLLLVLAEEGRSPMARLRAARDAYRGHVRAPVGLVLTVPGARAAA